jgi:hypothetical protein
MNHATNGNYYEIIIDDPTLTEHGFTKFSLPFNGNSTAARMVVHNTDKSKMMYPTFYKSDLGKTMQSLRQKIVSDRILIDNDIADGLVAYFRNAGALLSEDEDSPFFKNRYGNGRSRRRRCRHGSSSSNTSNIGMNTKSKGQKQQEEIYQQPQQQATIIDPSKDLDPYISGIHYTQFVIRSIKKNVKQEDSLVRLLVYAGLTAYSYNPLCIGIRAPTTEGKTYAVIQSILKYFPKGDYLLIGSISPKALIRQHGILVDKDSYQPLEPKIKELKKQIRESKTEDEKEELQEQLNQLNKEAKYLIDLSGKILLFLESPHPEVWEIIKTTLSHDAWEIEHPYVDTDLRTKNIVTRGWPACIFCSAKDESKWDVWPEIKSRFLIFSPNMSQEKYLESNILTFQKLGLPNFVQQQIIISDRDVELARKCILYLKQRIKSLCPICYDATTHEFKPLNPVCKKQTWR